MIMITALNIEIASQIAAYYNSKGYNCSIVSEVFNGAELFKVELRRVKTSKPYLMVA